MRTYPPAVTDLIEAGRFRVRYLLRVEFDGGAGGVWNDTYSLSYGGITYAPLAGNMDVSEVPSTSDLDSDRITVTVSGLQNAATTMIASGEWHQRATTLYVAFLNDADEVIHVEQRFSGFFDDLEAADVAGGLATLRASIENNNRELNRSTGDARSDGSQRRRSATDGFFKHAAYAAADTEIYWGRKGPQFPARAK